jgi:hypothetical protein
MTRHDAGLLRPSARGPCTRPAQPVTLSPQTLSLPMEVSQKRGTVANERGAKSAVGWWGSGWGPRGAGSPASGVFPTVATAVSSRYITDNQGERAAKFQCGGGAGGIGSTNDGRNGCAIYRGKHPPYIAQPHKPIGSPGVAFVRTDGRSDGRMLSGRSFC